MGTTDFVIVGFPKCGTTALAAGLDSVEGITVHRRRGRWESPFFRTDKGAEDWRQLVDPQTVNGHKFTAYVYRRDALERIRAQAPEALVIVCVRDPAAALASWREMHRRIATKGEANHFVNKSAESRRFYSTCSLSEYYRAYGRPRVNYAEHIRSLRSVLGDHRLMVVRQEWLVRNTAEALAEIARRLGVTADPQATATAHKPRTHTKPAFVVDPDIAEELDRYRQDLDRLQLDLAGDAVVLA